MVRQPVLGRSPERIASWAAGALLVLSLACADGGKKVTDPGSTGPPPDGPDILRLVPGRTVSGDTVRVEGSGFGAAGSSGIVTFTGESGRVQAEAVSWSESLLVVLVPDPARTGLVSVRADGVEGEGREFSVAPARVTFSADLLPLFESKGCVSCHTGPGASGSLHVDTASGLLRGGDHGPAALPRNGPGSMIVRKVSPNPPFGDRMPQGCSGGGCLTDEQILEISDWVDQGARSD